MRRIALLLITAVTLLLAGSLGFHAEATIGSGTQGLPSAAKAFSPVDRVACRFAGPLCPAGYTRVCRPWRCWCTRCR